MDEDDYGYGDDYDDDYGDGDDADEDRFEDLDDEPDLRPERDVFGRVGFGIQKDEDAGEKRRRKMVQSPLENFIDDINLFIEELNTSDIIEFTNDEREVMKRLTEKIEYIQYINPLGFVIGYYVTNGGQQIVSTRVNKIFEKINKIPGNINKPDIVRYARYVITLEK